MCVSTGNLCASCTARFNNGDISDIDIAVGKALLAVAKSQRFLSNITLERIVTTQDSVVLIVKKGDKEKLDRAGNHLLERLQAVDKRKFTFLDETKNPKALVEMLIGTDNVVSTSTVFLPPFSDKEIKIKLKKGSENDLQINQQELSQITKILLGMNAHFSTS